MLKKIMVLSMLGCMAQFGFAQKKLPVYLDDSKPVEQRIDDALAKMTLEEKINLIHAQSKFSSHGVPRLGIKQRFGKQADVVYARGYVGDVGGDYNGVKSGQDLKETRSSAELIAEAVKLAKESDFVVFVGGLNKSDHQDAEDMDRESYGLPYNQDAVISALAKANKNLAVVLVSGNAVAMPWIKEVPSVIQSWYLGSESGHAIAAILAGDANPSGKLPFTFPVKLEDNSAHALGEYPGNKQELAAGKGKDLKDPINITYNEGIFVGYRWHDTQHIKPLFSFGHGLSYTNFQYGKVKADKSEMTVDDTITFTVNVKNTGKVYGAEVAQLYVSDLKSSLPRPLKELKGFDKVFLKAGESKDVTITVDQSALSFFDPVKHDWVAEPGEFEVWVGSSSSDIRTTAKFTLR
ncbi:MAG TPA: hypothetical protein DD740_02290 [Chryseobacterium sp.]|nr:hypothetical protein [Chryseobacterium sp.]